MSKPKVHQLAAVMAQKTGPSDPRRLKLLDCISLFLQRVRMDLFFMFHGAGFLNLVPRFLQSLAPKVENLHDVQESDARPMPKAASSSDSRKGFFKGLKREGPELGAGDRALEKENTKVTVTVRMMIMMMMMVVMMVMMMMMMMVMVMVVIVMVMVMVMIMTMRMRMRMRMMMMMMMVMVMVMIMTMRMRMRMRMRMMMTMMMTMMHDGDDSIYHMMILSVVMASQSPLCHTFEVDSDVVDIPLMCLCFKKPADGLPIFHSWLMTEGHLVQRIRRSLGRLWVLLRWSR